MAHRYIITLRLITTFRAFVQFTQSIYKHEMTWKPERCSSNLIQTKIMINCRDIFNFSFIYNNFNNLFNWRSTCVSVCIPNASKWSKKCLEQNLQSKIKQAFYVWNTFSLSLTASCYAYISEFLHSQPHVKLVLLVFFDYLCRFPLHWHR